MTTSSRVKSSVMDFSASFDIVSPVFGGKQKVVLEYLDGGHGDDADGARIEA
jgi:hypothetical protein